MLLEWYWHHIPPDPSRHKVQVGGAMEGQVHPMIGTNHGHGAAASMGTPRRRSERLLLKPHAPYVINQAEVHTLFPDANTHRKCVLSGLSAIKNGKKGGLLHRQGRRAGRGPAWRRGQENATPVAPTQWGSWDTWVPAHPHQVGLDADKHFSK